MSLKTLSYLVSVRDSTTVLTLSSILSSFSATSLSNHLAVLRRDVSAYYIDRLLTQPASLTHSSAKDSSGISSETLSFLPSPSTSEDLSMRLKNLTSVLDFLDARLLAALPSSQMTSFKRTLCKPVTTALLQQFLVSHLPSSLAALPPYLRLVAEAKELEEKYIIGMFGQDPRDREVKTWVDAVSSHYERKRRAQILENARQMILQGDDSVLILVEVDSSDLPPPPPPPSSSAPATQSSGSGSERAGDVSDNAWGLEGEESGDTDDLVSALEEEDAWGFDDGPVEHEFANSGTPPESLPPADTLAESELATPVDDAAWGWDDNGEEPNPPANISPQASSSENSADWDDDPWGESSNPSSLPPAPTSVPKPASRLEKLANKAKAKPLPPRTPLSAVNSPAATPRPPQPAPAKLSKHAETNNGNLPDKKEPKSITHAETYAISKRAEELADTVDAIMKEGEEFSAVAIFDSKTHSMQTRGLVIGQTAPAVLDLFRALNPVKFKRQPTEPKSIVFANDCIYARGRALDATRKCSDDAKGRLLEAADSLNALGKMWFEQSIVSI
jgi:protein transport protein DSL1/ZW10